MDQIGFGSLFAARIFSFTYVHIRCVFCSGQQPRHRVCTATIFWGFIALRSFLYFVVKKDLENNRLIVSQGEEDCLFSPTIFLKRCCIKYTNEYTYTNNIFDYSHKLTLIVLTSQIIFDIIISDFEMSLLIMIRKIQINHIFF